MKLNMIAKSLGVAGCIVTLCDLSEPIAPFADYAVLISLLILVLLGMCRLFMKSWPENFSVATYLFGILLILSGTLLFLKDGIPDAKEKGLIASKVEVIESLQRSLGIVSRQLTEVNANLKTISTKMDNSKKEISQNPRKELANLGVIWSGESFYEAIKSNDKLLMNLFFKGGMQIDIIGSNYHGEPIVSMLMMWPPEDWESTMEMAIGYGYDFNTPIKTGDYKDITPLRLSFILDQFEISKFLISNGVAHEKIRQQVEGRLLKARKTVSEGEPQPCDRSKYDTSKTRQALAYRFCRDSYTSDIKKWHKTKENLGRYEKMLAVIREAS